MEIDEAEEALADAELGVCFQAALPEAKEIRDACLAAEIPVLLDRGACCGQGGCGCAPKIQGLALPQDVPRVAHLLRERWRAIALREGIIDDDHPALAAPAGEDRPDLPAFQTRPACPACGTAAPLHAGACSDCGLTLE